MDDRLNAILLYLKCLQYLRLKSSDERPNIKLIEQYVLKFSNELPLIPEQQRISIKTFLSHHSELFPHLKLEELATETVNLSSKSSQFENIPFFLEASHFASKIKKSSHEELIYYMDWCWELNQEAFVNFLLEILENGDPTHRNISISWIVEALALDDRLLFQFAKHSCGRIRDISMLHSEFTSAFVSSLQRLSYKNGYIDEPHRSNLERHVKCLRLAGLIHS